MLPVMLLIRFLLLFVLLGLRVLYSVGDWGEIKMLLSDEVRVILGQGTERSPNLSLT